LPEPRTVGIRGAITVDHDSPDLIRAATRELLARMIEANDLKSDDVISVIFTVTPDLQSEYPARAAREMGWNDVPLLCATEIAVPDGLAHCIRVLMHASSGMPRAHIAHVYLRDAVGLRSHEPHR
jgi:chorismate mutase